MAAFCDAIRQRDQRCVITGAVDLLRPLPATWSGIALDRSRRDYALLDRPEGAECGTSSAKETTSNRQRMASRRPSQIQSNSASPRASVVVDDVFSVTISTPTKDDGLQMDSSPSLLVVHKRGTLERLVDILVLGVEDFSERMDISEVGEPKITQRPSVYGFPKTLPDSQHQCSPRASVVVDDVCSITISTPTNDDSLQMESSPSLLVVYKRGTLERLVDIIFLGVEDFSKRMNSSGVGEPKSIQTPSGCGFPKTLPGSQHQYLSKGICGCG